MKAGTARPIGVGKSPRKTNGRRRRQGFGFIIFVDVASVAKAVEMDGKEMMSRRIKVKETDGNDGKPKFGGTPNGAPKPVRGGDAGGYWRDDKGQKDLNPKP
jgi:RNA recognition motif-containing protein